MAKVGLKSEQIRNFRKAKVFIFRAGTIPFAQISPPYQRLVGNLPGTSPPGALPFSQGQTVAQPLKMVRKTIFMHLLLGNIPRINKPCRNPSGKK